MRGQPRTCDAKKLSRRDTGENKVRLRKLCYFMIDFDTTAQLFQIAGESIWQGLSAAA
jgi:hypothetical protein